VLQNFDISVIDKSHDGILGMIFTSKLTDFKFALFSCYLSPDSSPWGRDATGYFAHLLSQMYLLDDIDSIIVCGDFNSRIGNLIDHIKDTDSLPDRTVIDTIVNQHGKALIDFLKESRLCILNGRGDNVNDNFTCTTARGRSVVDYIIIDHATLENSISFNVSSTLEICNNHNLVNLVGTKSKLPDHSLVSFHLNTNVHFLENPNDVENADKPTIRKKYNFSRKHANFMNNDICRGAIMLLIEQLEITLATQDNIDEFYERFKDEIVQEMNRNIPVKKPCSKSAKYFKRKPFWNDELYSLWKDMNKAEKEMRRNKGKGRAKQESFNTYKEKQREFDKRYRLYERQYKLKMGQDIEMLNTTNPTKFWEEISKLGPSNKKQNIPYEVYDNNGDIIYNKTATINKWREEFKKLYNPADNTNENLKFNLEIKNQNKQMENEQANRNENMYLNEEITIAEVEKAINGTKNGKSTGVDALPYEVFKNPLMIQTLKHLFQKLFESGTIPSDWRKAIIQPIPKSKDKDNRIPLNYRGVSLLCCTAKLYTSVINNRITKFCEERNSIADEQNGFRRDRSCLDHVFVLNSLLLNRKEQNLETFIAFIDLQKAFDSVNRDLLKHKLLVNGIDGKIYNAIKSIYCDNLDCVRINGESGPWFDTGQGVRQGDCLSPTLFSLFINDLITEINLLDHGIKIGEEKVNILCYADDIAIMAPTQEDLQVMLNALNIWIKKWQLKINGTKSQVMIVGPYVNYEGKPECNVGDIRLNYTAEYKYLGVQFDNNLSFIENSKILAESAGRALGAIIAKYKSNNSMCFSTYSKLFTSCVCPVSDYCAGVWGFNALEQADRIQARALRVFLGLHKRAPLAILEGDTGWIKPQYRRWLEMLRLWNRLISLPEDRLTYKIFKIDYENAKNGILTWSSQIREILVNINHVASFNNISKVNLTVVKSCLLEKQSTEWIALVASKPKLRFYRSFKTSMSQEKYVTLNLTPSERSLLAQIRSGTLPLEIEVGRFRNIKVEDRLCKLCNLNVTEDETHFIFECPFYHDYREDLFSYVINAKNDYVYLCLEDQLSVLFSEFPRKFAKFIVLCFQKRKDALYT